MKKGIIILLASLFSVAANAESAQDMLNTKVSQKPSTISLSNADSYSAEGVDGYEGRNQNRAGENLTSQVSSGTSVSKTINFKSSEKDSQLENLESTAGELVQKLEDDRLKKAKRHQTSFEKNKSLLQNAYNLVEDVNVNQLGSEQDPEVQNAFKCLDVKGCNEDPRKAKNNTDSRAIKDVCNKSQRLHWDGSQWKCVDLFRTLPRVSCSSKQYAKTLNGGVACIDYLYRWAVNGYTSCDSKGRKQTIVKCYQKKKLTDSNTTSVSDSNCLGKKPSVKTEQCTANWTVSSWGGCSKSCGTGSQTRAVTCPTGYKCIGAKPVTRRSCNTHLCTASWRTGSWSGCSKSCGGGSQSRSVTCPTGYRCTATKPATSRSCNTQACTCKNPVGAVNSTRSVTETFRRGGRNDNTWTETTCYKCSSSLTWQTVTCSGGSNRKDDDSRNKGVGRR
tara:strand:- start:1562 stop:2902 length:1341 start_codon:yes stop_codon:yes gene_type:complete